MLENGLTLKTRPPDNCFDDKGQLKDTKGGNADAAAAAMVVNGKAVSEQLLTSFTTYLGPYLLVLTY